MIWESAQRGVRMNHFGSAAFVVLAFCVAGVAGEAQTRDATKELTLIEQTFNDALVRTDWKLIDQLYADEIIFTNSDGSVSHKSDTVEEIRSGNTKFDSIEVSDVKVRDLGEVGVVTGKLVQNAHYGTTDLSGTYRFTDIWAKQEGKWRLVSGQETKIPRSQADSKRQEEKVMELERQWARAEEVYDPNLLNTILAEDFVSMDETGRVRNKAQEIASDGNWKPPGSEVVDDMSVRIYGNTAVVLGRFTWTDRNSGSVARQGRFVDTFLHLDGRWQVLANSYVVTTLSTTPTKTSAHADQHELVPIER